MRRTVLALLLLGWFALAQEEGGKEEGQEEEGGEEAAEEGEEGKPEAEKPPPAPGDGAKLLTDLAAANEAKDPLKVAGLLPAIGEFGKTTKNAAEADALAEELVKSLAFKDDDVKSKVVQTLGELRSKKAAGALKRIIAKKTKDEREEELVAKAVLSLGMLADPANLKDFEDAAKNRSVPIAKAAYEALKRYGTAKGKVRKDVAEMLMKRLDAEYPSSGGQQGKSVGEEAQKRWTAVSGLIVASLQSVCRQTTITDVENWREWWKENKKKPWKDSET
ncbi:MAG: HEAT repeat domain-containing protein [Planctomycetota bacterium]